MKVEFREYMTRSVRTSVRKYLELISSRLQFLISESANRNSIGAMLNAMVYRRNSVRTRMDRSTALRDIFINPLEEASSEIIVATTSLADLPQVPKEDDPVETRRFFRKQKVK